MSEMLRLPVAVGQATFLFYQGQSHLLQIGLRQVSIELEVLFDKVVLIMKSICYTISINGVDDE